MNGRYNTPVAVANRPLISGLSLGHVANMVNIEKNIGTLITSNREQQTTRMANFADPKMVNKSKQLIVAVHSLILFNNKRQRH